MVLNSRILFEESIKSKKSLETYTWYIQKFVDYYKLKDFDSILKIPKNEIQDMVLTYVIHTKKRVSPNSVSSFMKPIKLFLEINDVELSWKKIARLYPQKVKPSGDSAWQTEDIKKMLDSTTSLKNKAIIHFLASSGVRVGALEDVRLRHLRDMPNNCKMVLIYEDSVEEYHTFLTPEASKALDDYLDERKQLGEVFQNDSFLFRTFFTLVFAKPKPMGTKAIQSMIYRVERNAGIRGQKKNGRYATQSVHGFRKRFNTILKSNNSINDSAIEKMMGHKNGILGVYFQATTEQLFEDFQRGIMDLTIDQTEKQKLKILTLEQEKDVSLKSMQEQIDTLKELYKKK
jgi:integrase/recombinase XerD